MVLIVVLVVIALLSLAAYSWSELMLSEHRGSRVHGRLVQARVLAMSGLEALKLFLAQDDATQQQAGGRYDNAARFQSQLVVDSQTDRDRGRFAIVAPRITDGRFDGIRFGLEDESTRLNVNALMLADETAPDGGRTLLMALPGMTEDVADAILDWIDSDEDARELGCEAGDYYASLTPSYAPKNGPLQSIEELLLVRGVTPQLLFGADVNRNGMIDPAEEAAAADYENTDADGNAALGWAAFLTLYSQEKNTRPDGTPKINLNDDDLEKLHEEMTAVFPAEWVTFIIAYRQNGAYTGRNPSSGMGTTGELDLTQPGKSKLNQLLDLIGKRVQVQFMGEEERKILDAPFPELPLAYGTYLPVLMDYAAVNTNPVIPGRININQASRTILLGIPGMTEEAVTEIVSRRSAEVSEDNPARRHETWILNEGIVTLDEMKALLPYVTAGGSVFRGQIIGYFDQQGPAARAEVVVDATKPAVEQLLWREMSHLGRGYPLETLGIEIRE